MKHTPGPWKQGKTTPENVSAGSNLVCRTFKRDNYSREEIANARLISAAPDLLEALVDLLYQVKFSEHEGGWDFDQARSAIAKATGETKC